MKSAVGVLLLFIVSLMGCSGLERSQKEKIRKLNMKGELIYRYHDDQFYPLQDPVRTMREPYPWEKIYAGGHPRITKEYFRCKGDHLNPPKAVHLVTGQTSYYFDCGGLDRHSLPLKNGQEFIYPILIELLNDVQEKTNKKVMVTCGHRCPIHNQYVDASNESCYSKHMVGAEVDFYVEGMEWAPEKVVAILMEFYRQHPRYANDEKYTTFSDYKKTQSLKVPWCNQEVFIKLHSKDEGRDLDNQHGFPYITIQVRYDREEKVWVHYTWKQANQGYLQW